MEPLQRQAYIESNINQIIEDDVFLEEPEYDWAVRAVRHKGQWTYVEAVQRSGECAYNQVLLILTFVRGAPPENLATYVADNNMWTLHSNAQGMQFQAILDPAALPAAASEFKPRETDISDEEIPLDVLGKTPRVVNTGQMQMLISSEVFRIINMFGLVAFVTGLVLSIFGDQGQRGDHIAGAFTILLSCAGFVAWRFRTGILVAKPETTRYHLTRWYGICPPFASKFILVLKAVTSAVSANGHITIKQKYLESGSLNKPGKARVFAITIERAGTRMPAFPFDNADTYLKARKQAELLSDAIRMPLADYASGKREVRQPGTMNEPLRVSARSKHLNTKLPEEPPRGARCMICEAPQGVIVEIPPRPFMLKTYTAPAAAFNIDVTVSLIRFFDVISSDGGIGFLLYFVQIITTILFLWAFSLILFFDRQTCRIEANFNQLRITETFWFIKRTTVFPGEELEALNRRYFNTPFYIPGPVFVAQSDKQNKNFAISLTDEEADYLYHVILKALVSE